MDFGGFREINLLMIDPAAFGRSNLERVSFLGRLDDGITFSN